MLKIESGIKNSAVKVAVFGTEGIGKSSFAAKFPNPLFIDTEGSTARLDVRRVKPKVWNDMFNYIDDIKMNPSLCKTLIIDTADWAEKLAEKKVINQYGKDSIEGIPYGKGYVYLADEFYRFLCKLDELIAINIHVVIVAHSSSRKFEQPDEMGRYDRYEMKLSKHVCPLVKEWADMVLFFNYKNIVVQTGPNKSKVSGGKRVIYTTHNPCWDAKNRFGLDDELPMEYESIAHIIEDFDTQKAVEPVNENFDHVAELDVIPESYSKPKPEPEPEPKPEPKEPFKTLYRIMDDNFVTKDDIKKVVASKQRYYPIDTEIEKYDLGFVENVLIGAWDQVFEEIIKNKKAGI